MQSLTAFIALPWSIKILYGLISDNFPVFGSRRKSYLLIAAFLQFFSMAGLTYNSKGDLNLAVGFLFMSNLSVALADVIVDSLMVIQSRQYPNEGAEELNAYTWTCFSMGGFFGSIAAAFLTESYEPKYCFLYSCIMGFVMAFVAWRLNIQIEKGGE